MVEQIGGTVNWLSATNTIEIIYEDTQLYLKLNSKQIIVNGKKVNIDTPVQAINGISYGPVKFIAEVLGLTVLYQDKVIAIGKNSQQAKSSLDRWVKWTKWQAAAINKLPDILMKTNVNAVVQDDRVYYYDENLDFKSVKIDGTDLQVHNDKDLDYFYSNAQNRFIVVDQNSAIHQLSDNSYIIDIVDDIIYYMEEGGEVRRVRTDGTEDLKITQVNGRPFNFVIHKGYLYYTDHTEDLLWMYPALIRVRHDGKDKKVLVRNYTKNSQLRLIYNEEYQLVQSEFGVPYQIYNDRIYYIDFATRELRELNLNNLKERTLSKSKSIDTRTIIVDGEWIYYNESVHDKAKNKSLNRIKRMHLKSKKVEQLHEDAWLSHVHDGWVYYSKQHLFRMKLDGKERRQLTTGDRTDGDSVGFIVNDWIVFNRIYGFQPMSTFQMKSDGSQQKARELGDVLYK